MVDFISETKNQQQTTGLQNGELNTSRYGLTPGVYFLRFTWKYKKDYSGEKGFVNIEFG